MTVVHFIYQSLEKQLKNLNQKTNCSNIYIDIYRDRYIRQIFILFYLYVSTKYSQPFKKDLNQFQNLTSETKYLKQDNELRRPQTYLTLPRAPMFSHKYYFLQIGSVSTSGHCMNSISYSHHTLLKSIIYLYNK